MPPRINAGIALCLDVLKHCIHASPWVPMGNFLVVLVPGPTSPFILKQTNLFYVLGSLFVLSRQQSRCIVYVQVSVRRPYSKKRCTAVIRCCTLICTQPTWVLCAVLCCYASSMIIIVPTLSLPSHGTRNTTIVSR